MKDQGEAEACRRLWAAVVLAVLDDCHHEHTAAKRPRSGQTPQQVLDFARRWINSAWGGRQCCKMAGIEPDEGRMIRLIAMAPDQYRAAMTLRVPA